mmetsp:Transcript_271/g.651  ORF Transcript_271/g.651 Transcript_271/m.651 type:complete len:619 (-) Transcript_271:56-1912(-)
MKEVALGAWVAALLALAWRSGASTAATVLLLGAAPAVALATYFADALSPLTGLFPKHSLEDKKQQAQALAMAGVDVDNWLNVLLQQLWPHIAKYVEDLIKGFESTIQGLMPKGFSEVRFTKCSLGKEPPRFGKVRPRIVDSNLGGQSLEGNGLELEIDLIYESDVDIELSKGVASVGAANLRINGMLLIYLRPLLNTSPFIGGIEVVFANPPVIDVDFKGLANIADFPGVYSAVRRAIDTAIGGLMVSPNRKAFAISGDPAVDLGYLKNPTPEGMLRVTVLRAENLEANDLNYNMTRSSDPYVEVNLGATKWRTPTIDKNCNPVWKENNVHDFFVFSMAQLVYIDVFDADQFSDDSLGRVEVCSVETHVKRGTDTVALVLQQRTKKDNKPPADATLFLRFSWLHLVPVAGVSKEPEDGPNNYVVSLKVTECDGLPDKGCDAPFTVRLSIKGVEGSSVMTKPGQPKWVPSVTPKDIKTITQLSDKGVDPSLIAQATSFEESSVKALLADRPPEGASDDTYREWMARLEKSRNELEASRNPEFQQVLRVPLASRKVTAVVELLNSAKTPAVVGYFETAVGKDDVIEGPFAIQAASPDGPLRGYEPKLHGRFRLSALVKSL